MCQEADQDLLTIIGVLTVGTNDKVSLVDRSIRHRDARDVPVYICDERVDFDIGTHLDRFVEQDSVKITAMDQKVGIPIGLLHRRHQRGCANLGAILPAFQCDLLRPCRQLRNLFQHVSLISCR